MHPLMSIELARVVQAEKLDRGAGHHPGRYGRTLRARARIRRALRGA